MYSTRRQKQEPYPNLRKNPDTNANPNATNRWVTLRLNRTLRDVYTKANPNVSNRYFTLTPNRTLPDLYRNLAAIRLLAILFFITTWSSSSVRFRATAENRK